MKENQTIEWKRTWRDAGFPEPEVRYEPSGLAMVFRFLPQHQAGGDIATAEVLGRAPVETPVETPVKVLAKTPERILELLRANPSMTLAEVAEKVGRSLRAVERAVAKMADDGRLRFVGPRKAGRWEVLE